MNSQWSTTGVDARERFEYWRSALSNAFVPLEPVPGHREWPQAEEGFYGRISGLRLPSLRISTITADRHVVSLDHGGIARQQGAPFFVNLLQRGSACVSQYGERARAAVGDIYVVDSSAPWSVTFTEPFQMLCIEVGDEILRPRLGAKGRLPSCVLSGSGVSVLHNYLALLQEQSVEELDQIQDLVFEHCVSLLARTSASAAGLSPAARDGAAMCGRIFDFIERHLTDPALSPAMACEALRISRSYLFKLLAVTDTTFAQHVRELRLQASRQTLQRHPGRPVSQVAASWGFSDITTFNRLYRSRFGETPRQSRRQA